MPSDNCKSITAMCLIFSLFNIALSRDVHFYQLQQLQRLHHGFTKAYLVLHFFLHCHIGKIHSTWITALLQDLEKWSASRDISYVTLSLECCLKSSKSWKWNEVYWIMIHCDQAIHPLLHWYITCVHILMIINSVFSLMAALIVEMFSCCSLL